MRIPGLFIPEHESLERKTQELLTKKPKRKQDPYAKECAKLEEDIRTLRDELKKCEERRINHPEYYQVLTDPYREEREINMKLLRLELHYLEIKEYR